MSQTALSAYYESLRRGLLPASVPISTLDGDAHGLATHGYSTNTAEAQRLTNDDDPLKRAEAAIIVCSQSRHSLNARFEELTSP